MARLDYYAILGVSPQASDEEIKKVYRQLALKYHPDRNQGSPEAEIKIRQINAAYEILGNPDTRRSYERLRFGGYKPETEGPGPGAEDIIDPATAFQEMESKLQDEARKEMLSVLIKQPTLIKKELEIIRERIVEKLGYDAFREKYVVQRGKEILPHLLTEEFQAKRERLLDVALQMLILQNVASSGNEQEVKGLKRELEKIYDEGWLQGYTQACNLFYVRR
ncbi:MAG: DnaJ domain-containing protein [Nitrospirota bacterium]|nr:MAG: DnaJ domain-containing protein [Nitrospirota bacterium]